MEKRENKLHFTEEKIMDKVMCPITFIPNFGINYPLLLKPNDIEHINFAFFKFCNTLFEIANDVSHLNANLMRRSGIMGEAFVYASEKKGSICTIMEYEEELRNIVQEYIEMGNEFENDVWKKYIFTHRNYIG